MDRYYSAISTQLPLWYHESMNFIHGFRFIYDCFKLGLILDEKGKRVKGIEPSSSAWKAVALPLSYTRPFS